MIVRKPLILFIDAYDSFSNNIISLLETSLSVTVRTIKIDDPALASPSSLHRELKQYAAVVCGPGPGHPEKEEDVGIMSRIWKLGEEDMLPVLGICLGFQSLCREFGGRVVGLQGPQHGMIRGVSHLGEYIPVYDQSYQGVSKVTCRYRSIFAGVGELQATHYHSLCVELGHKDLPKDSWDYAKWNSTKQCPDLVPLAWVESDLSKANNSGVRDEAVLVAVEHKTKPFWGLQYHPESICSNEESEKVIINWFKYAQQWNLNHMRTPEILQEEHVGQAAKRESLLSQYDRRCGDSIDLDPVVVRTASNEPSPEEIICHYHSMDIPTHVTSTDIMEALLDFKQDQIILDSSNSHAKSASVRGRYTIVALDVARTSLLKYRAKKHEIMEIRRPPHGLTQFYDTREYGGIWPFLAQYMENRKVSQGNPESPFWGGLVGYTTYELGLETIDVASKARVENANPTPSEVYYEDTHPDLCFAWIQKSLIIDHEKRVVYFQALGGRGDTIIPEDLASLAFRLSEQFWPARSLLPTAITLSPLPHTAVNEDIIEAFKSRSIPLPNSIDLQRKDDFIIPICHYDHLDVGRIAGLINHSCNQILGHEVHVQPRNLQFQNHASLSHQLNRLVQGQPVTFTQQSTPALSLAPTTKRKALSIQTPNPSTYESKVRLCQQHIRAGDSYELCLTSRSTITSPVPSSPTPSWTLYKTLRRTQPAPFASYIKLSTLTFLSASPERFLSWTSTNLAELRPMKGTVKKSEKVRSLEQAKELLAVPKEIAENLMIVDLVRHDLYGVCGSGNVDVERLMVVQEFESLFQMISVVRGQIPSIPFPTSSAASENGEIREWKEKERKRYTGLDILAASLPPGSMTGAPKKRSCELLQEIEDGERGLYSGIVGYLDVGGRGDWSVNIRCLFKYEDDDGVVGSGEKGGSAGMEEGKKTEKWNVGAGGAVTILSSDVGEREEMEVKLKGSLLLFEPVSHSNTY